MELLLYASLEFPAMFVFSPFFVFDHSVDSSFRLFPFLLSLLNDMNFLFPIPFPHAKGYRGQGPC